jgi:hypothetical protein
MGVLKDDIKVLYDKFGENIVVDAARELMQKMHNPDKDVTPVNLGAIEKGKFYFMLYDIASKTSKMEKFSPVFIADWSKGNSSTLYAVSLNFIPANIRIVVFDAIVSGDKGIYTSNKEKDVLKNKSFGEVDLQKMYNILQMVGFEYSIREFDLRLVNKLYAISTNFLPKLITMSTELFTGVGEHKMAEIWAAKIKQRDERHKEFVKGLWEDYDKMSKTILSEIKNVTRATEDISSVIINIKNANKNK